MTLLFLMGLVIRRPLKNDVSRSILSSHMLFSRCSLCSFYFLFVSSGWLIGFSFIEKKMPNFYILSHVVIGLIWDDRLGQPLN